LWPEWIRKGLEDKMFPLSLGGEVRRVEDRGEEEKLSSSESDPRSRSIHGD